MELQRLLQPNQAELQIKFKINLPQRFEFGRNSFRATVFYDYVIQFVKVNPEGNETLLLHSEVKFVKSSHT